MISVFFIGLLTGFLVNIPNPLNVTIGYDESFERTIDKMNNMTLNISAEKCPDCVCDNTKSNFIPNDIIEIHNGDKIEKIPIKEICKDGCCEIYYNEFDNNTLCDDVW